MISAATTAYRQRRYINAHHTSRDHHSATTEFSSDRAPRRPSNRRSVLPHVNDPLQLKLKCRRPPLNPGISSPIRKTLIFHNGSVFFRSPLSYYARSTKCGTAEKCCTAVASRISSSTETHVSRRDPIRVASDRTDLASTFRFIRRRWTVRTTPTGAPQHA